MVSNYTNPILSAKGTSNTWIFPPLLDTIMLWVSGVNVNVGEPKINISAFFFFLTHSLKNPLPINVSCWVRGSPE